MRHLVIKDQFRRRVQTRWEIRRKLLTGFSRISLVDKLSRLQIKKKIASFSKNTAFRSHNRCLLTRRSKFVLRMFGMERRVLRDKFLNGYLPAIQRVIW